MDNHQINSYSLGNGQPVILVHGMASSINDWTSLAPELASNGFTAFALDLLGHGESAKPDDPQLYHIESIYSHFQNWVASLNLDTPPVLVGHSLGGYISLVHAIRHPEAVRCLVLIDPYFESHQLSLLMRLVSRRPTLGEKAMRVTPQWLIHTVIALNPDTIAYFSKEAHLHMAADLKRASPHFVYITRNMPDLTDSLHDVNAPTLVIWGERDQTLRPASFPRLVQILPNATGYPVNATGHQPHISKPELINRLTLEFLAKWAKPGDPVHHLSTHFDESRDERS